ncbi:MAG: acyltransferase family protein [Phascolarctobacterium sp.]|uniref:acyltransferase n=1 Tax=Phascolarctobacterium sp. TaxID=2049039 RepID=UPI0026DB81F0|nr:acyltransferase family protein [Phascolarctobacterium sp.]MDO4921400.1 acyltransferase family protein [Phascolarctobacterium sp.]
MREKYIDFLRIISAYGVVLLHSTAYAIYDYNGKFFNEFVFLNTFTRLAVPIFFMCSGASVLKADFKIDSLYKRVKRILYPLLFWSFFYEFYLIRCGVNKTFLSILSDILHDKVMYHMWFLYALLGVYLLIPFLCKMLYGMSFQDWKWFWTLSTSIILCKTIFTYHSSYLPISFTIIPTCVIYVIAGYYLANFEFINKRTFVQAGGGY